MIYRALHTDPTLGTRWLHQMNLAARQSGLSMEFCMSLPRQGLTTLELPSVSHARVSEDYVSTQVIFLYLRWITTIPIARTLRF